MILLSISLSYDGDETNVSDDVEHVATVRSLGSSLSVGGTTEDPTTIGCWEDILEVLSGIDNRSSKSSDRLLLIL